MFKVGTVAAVSLALVGAAGMEHGRELLVELSGTAPCARACVAGEEVAILAPHLEQQEERDAATVYHSPAAAQVASRNVVRRPEAARLSLSSDPGEARIGVVITPPAGQLALSATQSPLGLVYRPDAGVLRLSGAPGLIAVQIVTPPSA